MQVVRPPTGLQVTWLFIKMATSAIPLSSFEQLLFPTMAVADLEFVESQFWGESLLCSFRAESRRSAQNLRSEEDLIAGQ